jgi:diguanylate cyclase (GGDEF)-like protein
MCADQHHHAELARLQAEVEWLRAERDALAWAVGHDELTGLANRRLFTALAPEILERGGAAALMIVDLNGFKPINDTLGHDAGDEVLRVVARRMDAWGRGDLVARIGGDEFAGVLTSRDTTAPDNGWRRAATVLAAAIAEPIRIFDRHLRITASIGIAPAYDDAGWAELLRRADLAMYRAKMDRQCYALWDTETDSSAHQGRHAAPVDDPQCLEFALFASDQGS